MDYLQRKEDLRILDEELSRSEDGKTFHIKEAQYLIYKPDDSGSAFTIPKKRYDKMSEEDKGNFRKDKGKIRVSAGKASKSKKKSTSSTKIVDADKDAEDIANALFGTNSEEVQEYGRNDVQRRSADGGTARRNQSGNVVSDAEVRYERNSGGDDRGRFVRRTVNQGVRVQSKVQKKTVESANRDLRNVFHISGAKENGLPDAAVKKFIDQSFSDLTPQTKSYLAKTLKRLGTAVVYYGDKDLEKVSGTMGRQYTDINMIKIYKSAIDELQSGKSLDGYNVGLHEAIHAIVAAADVSQGRERVSPGTLKAISNSVEYDWAKTPSPEHKAYVNELIKELKDPKVKGITPKWKVLAYVHALKKPALVDYLTYRISQDPKAIEALKKKDKFHIYAELSVAKSIAAIQNAKQEMKKALAKLENTDPR